LPLVGDIGHAPKVTFTSESVLIHSLDLESLLRSLLIRVRVLLQSGDTVLDLRTTQTSEQKACLNA
jgi:hypothetical protein